MLLRKPKNPNFVFRTLKMSNNMPNKDFPYSFVQVKAGEFIRLDNGQEIKMTSGGLVVVFQTTGDVLGPFQSRHQAETEASCHVRKLLYGGGR